MSDAESTDDELANLLARLNCAADLLEFPARRVGPAPHGAEHTNALWGVHLRTDRDVHLGQATVHAGESGSFTALLGEYDGGDRFDPVHERSIDVDAGRNEIDLDMALDPGEYLRPARGAFRSSVPNGTVGSAGVATVSS